jgi:glycerophosphoryl diester phosphodiesterase
MAVHYWTIDDKEDMRLLIENGADGLITDRPDIMLELLEEMGFE